jgi:hypothetical protein
MIKKTARFAFTVKEKGLKNMAINQVFRGINAPIVASSF